MTTGLGYRWGTSGWLIDPVLYRILLFSAWTGNEAYLFTDPHVRAWVAVPLTVGLTALTGVWVLLPLLAWARAYLHRGHPRRRLQDGPR
jgi:hypothetical protein